MTFEPRERREIRTMLDRITGRLSSVKWDFSDRDARLLAIEILEGQHGPVPTEENWITVVDAVAAREVGQLGPVPSE